MPCAVVNSNVSLSGPQQDEFCIALTKVLAEATSKPLAYCMAVFKQASMSFGGSTDPCVFVDFSFVGKATPEFNAAASKMVTDCCTQYLGVAADRVYIRFTGVPGCNWGYNGGTF